MESYSDAFTSGPQVFNEEEEKEEKMTLPNKYRPRKLSQMIGNSALKKKIETELNRNSNERAHTYLITGPSGCGKTTLGRIIATEANVYDPSKGHNPNFTEMDSASFRGIDTIRSIRERMRNSPLGKREYRVYLLDEVHQVSKDAQEALLKALEDTPKHVIFVLCTTEPQKLKITIRQRCFPLELSSVDNKTLEDHLKYICEQEEKKEPPEEVLDAIIQRSNGAPRLALSLLNQVIDLKPKDMEKVLGKESDAQTKKLANVLINDGSWAEIREVLNGIKGEEPERIRRAVLGYCQAVLLKRQGDQVARVLQTFMEPVYDSGFPGIIGLCYAVHKGE